jgi:hypothetical protein
MYIAKPHKKGDPAALDGSDRMTEVSDLTAQSGAENLNMQDDLPYNNPDAAGAPVAVAPDFRGGHPQGNLRGGNQSGGGRVHKTGQTSAPMSNPFPGPVSNVRTSPSTIKE